jgi:hypothetical protein
MTEAAVCNCLIECGFVPGRLQFDGWRTAEETDQLQEPVTGRVKQAAGVCCLLTDQPDVLQASCKVTAIIDADVWIGR